MNVSALPHRQLAVQRRRGPGGENAELVERLSNRRSIFLCEHRPTGGGVRRVNCAEPRNELVYRLAPFLGLLDWKSKRQSEAGSIGFVLIEREGMTVKDLSQPCCSRPGRPEEQQ